MRTHSSTLPRIINTLLGASTVAILVFISLFVVRNLPGLTASALVATIGALYAVIFAMTAIGLMMATASRAAPLADPASVMAARLLLPALLALIVWIFLDATVTDYYQPISLFDDVIAALAVSWALLCAALALIATVATRLSPSSLRRALFMAAITLLGWPLTSSLALINTPEANASLDWHGDVFVGGEDGYAIYRIPGLLVIPASSRLASGEQLVGDRLLAFAEARRDGALDTGVIDLVLKHSDDGGANWSAQRVVCRHKTDGIRGKCGNATPVFDRQKGTVLLAYNTSISSEHQARNHSSAIVLSDDGGLTWSEPRDLAGDNLVFGPGHGIQKSKPPHAGRLVLPGYLTDHALVLYSDDGGSSWQRSEALDTGNETEVAELPGGGIYLTTRHRAPIGRPPEPNGRLFSVSQDGGHSWSATEVDTALTTPICQASVVSHPPSGGVLFSNPAHPRARVRLTLRHSTDNGASWPWAMEIYPGPAGYSVLGVSSEGDPLILYERGNMAYSEKISFARVPAELLPSASG